MICLIAIVHHGLYKTSQLNSDTYQSYMLVKSILKFDISLLIFNLINECKNAPIATYIQL